MIRKIKLILNRKLSKKNDTGRSSSYATVAESTFLPNGLNIRFDADPEERKYVQIGEHGLIYGNFIFESQKGFVQIGNNVHLGGVTFICRSEISVEDDVTMAWGITIYDHDSHSIYWEERKNDNIQCYEDYKLYKNNVVNKNWANVKSKPIKICSKVWIGFDVTILKGVTVGEGAVIAAKSVVSKDVPAWTVVAGNPAKVVKEIDRS